MKRPPHRVSMGALALVACLALPAGLLSLLSETTTGEQVDASDLIVVGRVASVQFIASPESTALEFAVDHAVFGVTPAPRLHLSVPGHSRLDVGDDVVVLARLRPATLIGTYLLRRNPTLLDDEVVTPITGMFAQGITGGDRFNPVPLSLFEAAIRMRLGVAGRGVSLPANSGARPPAAATGVGPDAFEPNNTLATAALVTGLHNPTLLTGNPTILTGLTLTPNDVDFFKLQCGALQILHAATLAPATGLDVPNTLIGLFEVSSGKLLAHDDDSGPGTLSQFVVPLENAGPYALAVESAPDSNLDFDGSEGTTTGSYSLSVEFELGSYLWNSFDVMLGVSPDGSFIEDTVGFKEIGKPDDLLMAGVPADGWAVDYDAGTPASGVTHVFGGAGDQLTDPGFTNPLTLVSFEIGGLDDVAGINRHGHAASVALVGYTASVPPLGVLVDTSYKFSNGAKTLIGGLTLERTTPDPVENLKYTRVMDVDLFGTGADEFFWSFNPSDRVKAFAADAATNVGNVAVPAQAVGQATGDQQAVLLIEHGSSSGPLPDFARYKSAFTYITGFTTSAKALNEAVRRLRHEGVRAWVVAVDADPATGLFAAFGAGLGPN